eukprot:5892044-Ditylum_brightwellii.AAC.1
MFLRNNVVSPGVFTMIHPILVRKEDYSQELLDYLNVQNVPNTEACQDWLKEHAPNHTNGEEAPVPKFRIVTAVTKWGKVTVKLRQQF